ncbi:leucine-rich repeat-containing protein 74B-like isoform X2 [Bolinopsis microptera]|uniref:leucine-rich repeat-containing protein 74B-like isoform X2 n=1 Tax=Bolinopsis microptera TaxID=2820187 RepID=UPI00307A8028
MTELPQDSFLTELKDEDDDEAQQLPPPPSNHDNGQFVTPDPDPKLLKHLSVLYEDLEEGDDTSFPINSHRRVPSETGSEYDTDLEDTESPKRTEYDSSGIGDYLKICEDMNMRPVSHFMRQTKNPSLSLRYQSLGCRKTVAITQALTSNTFVECLDLSDNDIGCDGMVSIAHMLTENYFITELSLEDNKIGLRGVATLCDVLSEHSYVKHLNLAGNGLNDPTAGVLGQMLKVNYTLTCLNVRQNQFSCLGAKAIAEALLSNDSLNELDISWNKIRSRGSEAIGKMVATNTGLISLNVSFNGLDALGAAAFTKAIKTNSQLVNLDLINTRIPGSECKELGKALALNTTLKIVKLGNNPFKEPDIELLFHGLTTTSLYIIGLEDIPLSKGLYERLQEFEKEQKVVIHYGRSGGNQRSRPMTSSALRLDEFITTNLSKLAPLVLAKDKDKTGQLTVSEFKECLQEAGLRLRQNELNRLVDKLNLREDQVPHKEILMGKIPSVLERMRNSAKQKRVKVNTEENEDSF